DAPQTPGAQRLESVSSALPSRFEFRYASPVHTQTCGPSSSLEPPPQWSAAPSALLPVPTLTACSLHPLFFALLRRPLAAPSLGDRRLPEPVDSQGAFLSLRPLSRRLYDLPQHQSIERSPFVSQDQRPLQRDLLQSVPVQVLPESAGCLRT